MAEAQAKKAPFERITKLEDQLDHSVVNWGLSLVQNELNGDIWEAIFINFLGILGLDGKNVSFLFFFFEFLNFFNLFF